MGVPAREGIKTIHHARHRTELIHVARLAINGKAIAVVAAPYGRSQRITQVLFQRDKRPKALHLFLLIHLLRAVLHEFKYALVVHALAFGQTLVGELAAVVALEVQVEASHEARTSPGELVLSTQAASAAVKLDNTARNGVFERAANPVQHEARRAVVRCVRRAIFETNAALALAHLLGCPLPHHKPTRAARSISGSVRSERTRIEQVRGIVQMQQERQLRMGVRAWPTSALRPRARASAWSR